MKSIENLLKSKELQRFLKKKKVRQAISEVTKSLSSLLEELSKNQKQTDTNAEELANHQKKDDEDVSFGDTNEH